MNKLISTLVMLFLLTACQTEDPKISNLNNNRLLVLGHAGTGLYHFNTNHDNSVDAIEKAIEGYGIDGIEIDLQISSDSVIFLYHDAQLESTSTCEGCIPTQSSSYIDNCRFKRNYSVTLLKESYITRLEYIFNRYTKESNKIFFFLNLKSPNECMGVFGSEAIYYEVMIRSICSLVRQYNLQGRVMVEVESEKLAALFKANEPSLMLFLTAHDPAQAISEAAEMGIKGIIASNGSISTEQVNEAHSKNLWVCIFGMKTEKDTRDAVTKNPEIILADNIAAALQVLAPR